MTEIQTGRLGKVIDFIKVSPIQQLSATANTASAITSGVAAVESFNYGWHYVAIGLVVVSLLNLACVGFHENKAVGIFKEYKNIKQKLTNHSWNEKIIEPRSHTWCLRNAARVAAIDSGHKQDIDQYYKEQGHKWYHFLK